MKFYHLILLSIFLLLTFSCEQRKSELAWDQAHFQSGSQSSPRAADLNQDGVLDIVIGAGKGEVNYTEKGVIALDGNTGELLWQQESSAQMAGSASFCDINGDKVPDVLIGGREMNLMALNGKTGEKIWSYEFSYENDPILQYAHFNFYTGVLVPDQNGDGVSDFLTINGGNWRVKPNVMEERYPGVLMLFDSKTGEIIAADTMPDRMESYMSPIAYREENSDELKIIFGSGGETASGNLFQTSMPALLNNDISQAKIIASEKRHGFIGPPVIVDLNQDGIQDIISASHGGTLIAISGKDHQKLWAHTFPDMESSNSFAVGFFNNDDVPDLFTTLSQGVWPENKGSLQVMIDGKTGKISYKDSIGCYSLASPVAYDLDGDGIDEVIFTSNQYRCSMEFTEKYPVPDTLGNQMVFLNLKKKTYQKIAYLDKYKNIFSSPWIGDIEHDGYLDLIYCQYMDPGDLLLFRGMRIRRISLPVPIRKEVTWGAYMGSDGDGVFSKKAKALQ